MEPWIKTLDYDEKSAVLILLEMILDGEFKGGITDDESYDIYLKRLEEKTIQREGDYE